MRSALSLVLAVLVALSSFSPAEAGLARGAVARRAVGPTITVKTGTYQGKLLSRVEQWLGVPYCQPPLGDLRFRRPQPLPVIEPGDPAYGNLTSAMAFFPRCIQSTSKATSEDCLKVNIYRPQGTAADAKLPAMVYLYGGSFIGGGSNGYSPTNLVLRSKTIGKPTILVTLDYRLGVLGFGASPSLRKSGDLNLGLHDQRQALRWIHDNIEYFGGDPDKVLLFGQSAGAISVSLQMLAYGGNITELIRGAIMESGAPGTTFAFDHTSSFPAYKFREEDEKWAISLDKAGCTGATDDLACLRQATTTQLLAGQSQVRVAGGFPYPPIIDGEFLTDVPSKLFASGAFANIPFISGTQLDEGPDFISTKAFTSLNLTLDSQMIDWIMAQTPGMTKEQATTFLSIYPSSQSYGSPFNTGNVKYLWKQFKRASAIFGDLAFEAPRRAFLAAANDLDNRNKATAAAGSLITSTTTVTQTIVTDLPLETTIDAGTTTEAPSSSPTSALVFSTSTASFLTSSTPSLTTDSTLPSFVSPASTSTSRYTSDSSSSTSSTESSSFSSALDASSPSFTPPASLSSTSTGSSTSSSTTTTSSPASTPSTCAATVDCSSAGYAIPANSHYSCNRARGQCGWTCNTGFSALDGDCVKPTAPLTISSSTATTATTTTTSSTSSSTTTSTLVAAATPSTCAATVDCSSAGYEIPADSHYACNKARGQCGWACNSGYSSTGSSCIKPGATSSTTLSAITSSMTSSTTASAAPAVQTCTASSQCLNVVPADANRYCSKGVCSFRCRTGFTLTGGACLSSSLRLLRRRDEVVEASVNASTVLSLNGTFSGEITTTVVTTEPYVYKPLNVWSYQFSQHIDGSLDYLGVSHGDEIPWVWGNVANPTADQTALMNAMGDYWIYFASDLDPNGPTSPIVWPRYEQSNLTQISFRFGEQTLISDTYRARNMDYINSNANIFGQ